MRENDQWVREVGADDPIALADLRTLLVGALGRSVGDRGIDVESLAHDALLKIRTRLAEFRGDSRFTTWAIAIALRVAFDELRRKRWQDVSLDALPASADLADADPAPDRHILRARVHEALAAALDALSDRQRQALVAELGGMPQAEIARRLDSTRNALYKLLHDARKRVKAELEARGLAADDVLWVFS